MNAEQKKICQDIFLKAQKILHSDFKVKAVIYFPETKSSLERKGYNLWTESKKTGCAIGTVFHNPPSPEEIQLVLHNHQEHLKHLKPKK